MKQLNLWSERHLKLELLVAELEQHVTQLIEAERAAEKAQAALMQVLSQTNLSE